VDDRSSQVKHRLKRRSRYKALGHYLDPLFTSVSRLKMRNLGVAPNECCVPILMYSTDDSLVSASLHLHFVSAPDA
ncbi:hypothetical protein HAX54_024261, partial [Datura stramonium]|nr:hypothetical protein [Datura stramonium]